jgi:flavin-dependent dehydrogenase
VFRHGTGLGVRRTTLHLALAIRAEELGVEVLAGKVDTVVQDADSVTAAGVRARWLMACDGLHSTVRRQLGLQRPDPARSRRYGVRRHYRLEPWTDLVEVHWGRHVEAYVTPVAPDVVGVALLGPPHHDYERTLDTFPALRRHLGDAQTVGPPRGAGPMLQKTLHRTAGRVRLVGDASGYVDALTGEGVRVGLAQAAAAVRTLGPDVDRSSAAYEKAWAAATRDYRRLTGGLLVAARSPLRSSIVPISAAVPSLYSGIVERLAR